MTEHSLDKDLEMMLEGEGTALKGRSDVDEIVKKLEEIAFADSRELYNDEGKQISPKQWPDDIAGAVVRITPNAYGLIVQLADKGRALEALARIKGAFRPDDETLSPLEELFSSVPRADQLLIVKQLQALSRTAQDNAKQDADVDESDTLRQDYSDTSDDELPEDEDNSNSMVCEEWIPEIPDHKPNAPAFLILAKDEPDGDDLLMSGVTIKQFCKSHRVTSQLIEYLALLRYRQTLQIRYPREK